MSSPVSAAADVAGQPPRPGWGQQLRRRIGHSIKWRLVLLFLLLALGMSLAFFYGMQKTLAIGWREAARPLLVDYVDRLASDLGSPPEVERARALVQSLPISVRISGPLVNFDSHPKHPHPNWESGKFGAQAGNERLLSRKSADGHLITFGLGDLEWRRGPGLVGWITLAALLALTVLAYLYVRRLLRPLDAIGDGARRIGSGDFTQPIVLRRREQGSELGDLAHQINTMGGDIHQMLEAKRGLLLAISHELRSPLTRARLNIELLPETGGLDAPREALKRDMAEMGRLISDLLESERLSSRHAALHLETTDLAALVRAVAGELGLPAATAPRVEIEAGLPSLPLDATRIRLLLRNLMDNALRFNPQPGAPGEVTLRREGGQLVLCVRDFGPGVDGAQLTQLGEAFYRPDAARQRSTGGVGLGLHLCKLVAQAHGGTLAFRNAVPGLAVTVTLPILLGGPH